MRSYRDLTLIRSTDISQFDLWAELFKRVHRVLVDERESGADRVALSFPDYDSEKKRLGFKLRLFSDDSGVLEALSDTFESLDDYVHVTRVKEVPKNVAKYISFQRVQPKTSSEAIARRTSARSGRDYEEVLAEVNLRKIKKEGYPFVKMKSVSSGRFFKLHIKADIFDSPKAGKANTYGLSLERRLPHF